MAHPLKSLLASAPLLDRWTWRLLLAQWGGLLAVFVAFRLAFLLLYRADFAGIPAAEVWDSLLWGLRFDLSALFFYTGLPGLALLLASPWRRRVAVFWVQFGLVAALALVMFVLMGMDLFYYPFVGRRLSFEAVAMLNEWRPIAALVGKAYLPQALAILSLLGGLLLLAVRTLRRLAARPRPAVPLWSLAAQAVLLLLATVVLARGGLQVKPISENMAFRGPRMALGHLSLNAVFTATKAFDSREEKLSYYPPERALRIASALLGLPQPPPDPKFPLLRRQEEPPPATRRNLVVIVLESFSPQVIASMGGRKGVTENFDRLTRDGLLFTNFYASGTRSLEGIPAIVTGYPALPSQALIGSSLEQSALSSLAVILHDQGYATFFLHGAYRGSMYFDQFAARNGFERFIAKEDFPAAERKSDSTWGIFDHYSLERLHEELEAAKKPVFALYFSLSSHSPYELPDARFAKFSPDTPDAPVLNSFAYADFALGRFFALARNSDYWKDTVFIVTADHNMGGQGLNHLQAMHIPLLILNPGDPSFPRGRVNTTLGGQPAIAPTALQLLGVSARQSFGANSLLAPAPRRFSLFAWGGTAGWIDEKSLLVHDLSKPLALYHYREDPDLTRNVLAQAGPEDATVSEFQGYLQVVNNLLISNRVFSPR